MTQTTNHEWDIPTVGGDEGVWGEVLNAFFDDELDKKVVLKGPFSERPSATEENVDLFLATDRKIVYYNNSTSWQVVYGLGTVDNPVPDTSYFENLNSNSSSVDLNFGNAVYETLNDVPNDLSEGDQVYVSEENSIYIEDGE